MLAAHRKLLVRVWHMAALHSLRVLAVPQTAVSRGPSTLVKFAPMVDACRAHSGAAAASSSSSCVHSARGVVRSVTGSAMREEEVEEEEVGSCGNGAGAEGRAPLVVVSFYKFANLPDYEQKRAPLKELCESHFVSGGIILASEGINGSICGTREAVEVVMSIIQSDERLAGLRRTEAPAELKDEEIHHGHTGTSATPHSWSLNKSTKLSSSRTVVSRCFLPATLRARRTRFLVAATSNEGGESKDPVTSTSSVSEETKSTAPEAVNSISEKRAKAEAEVKNGQRTAIVTGAISVLLGVGYLVLTQLLDTRGVILVPPPPEAFNP